MFRHVGISVKNMNKQLEFYKNIIGLEVYYDKIETGEFIEHIVGIKNAKVHIVKLGFNGDIIVELLDFNINKKKEYKKITSNGITHFAITVDDVEKLCKKVITINKPTINKEKTVKVAFCKDFEGNFIELVELL